MNGAREKRLLAEIERLQTQLTCYRAALEAVAKSPDFDHESSCPVSHHYDELRFIPATHHKLERARRHDLKSTEPPCACAFGAVHDTLLDN